MELHEELQAVLECSWCSSHEGTVEDAHEKLRAIDGMIQKWGSRSFGALCTKLRELRKTLHELRLDSNRMSSCYEENKVEQRIVELGYHKDIMW